MSRKLHLTCLIFCVFVSPTLADDAAGETHLLRYSFTETEAVRWRVVHLGTTETTIQGNTQTSKSRSESTKVWKVSSVDSEGNITFVHSVEHVDMWQQLTDRPEVRYNSEQDKKAPPEYEHVAKTVGVPIATVTINSKGDVIKREPPAKNVNFGIGGIVMLLPPKPVKVGSRWHEPSEVRARLPDSRVKRVKIRKLYELTKVKTGVATISVKTEVLTPVNDPRIESQIVQQLTAGTIKFDLEAGRIISKQMDWDETVVGFNGADSLMKYLARFTEELLPPKSQTAGKNPKSKDKPLAKTARGKRTDAPVLRRK